MKLARSVGLQGIRLHDARHTHASLLLKQGVHPEVVQERLGHASIVITLDTYSHVASGLQEAAAKRFEEYLHPKSTSGEEALDAVQVDYASNRVSLCTPTSGFDVLNLRTLYNKNTLEDE